ncbi:MAG TPA: hypothetical protein PKC27_10895, partial [Methanomethylovorans sp.]|nr:hypothetical protein [Methanomethylovorans sp.]
GHCTMKQKAFGLDLKTLVSISILVIILLFLAAYPVLSNYVQKERDRADIEMLLSQGKQSYGSGDLNGSLAIFNAALSMSSSREFPYEYAMPIMAEDKFITVSSWTRKTLFIWRTPLMLMIMASGC